MQAPTADRFQQITGSPLQASASGADYGTQRHAFNQAVTNSVVSYGLDLDAASLEALAIGESPVELRYEALTQLAQLSVDVSGGRGKLNGSIYAYAEGGSATFVTSAEAYKSLGVDGLPLQAGSPTPDYGINVILNGQWVTNSVDLYGMDASVDNRIRYRFQGYTLANQGGLIDAGTTNRVAVQLSENLTLT